MSARRRALGLAIAAAVVAGVLGWAILPRLLFAGLGVEWSRERPFDAQQFNAVAQEIGQGRLRPNGAGVATLPPTWARLTVDGKVYVTDQPGGGRLALFIVWRGRGGSVAGYVADAAGSGRQPAAGQTLDLIAPSPGPSQATDRLTMTVERVVDARWTYVTDRSG